MFTDPATLLTLVMLVSLIAYALSAGADFGGGVWDLLASGPRARKQRETIEHAIGPIWEANHVWMILVIVLLFVGFPRGFAAILTALHIPVTLMLIGITLRGSAFVFRSYGRGGETEHARWGRVFAISSTITPFFLGVTLGAITSGSIKIDPETQHVTTDFFSEWFAIFPAAIGVMVVALFAFIAAVYLAAEVEDPLLQDDFRIRGIASGVFFGLTAAIAALLSQTGAPHLWEVLAGDPLAITMQAVTGAVAISALASLYTRKFKLARLLAMIQVLLVIMAWAVSQQGQILVGALSVEEAAAPDSVLVPVLYAIVAGMAILIPSLVYLFKIFKGAKKDAAKNNH